jgi:cytochrome c-type biogenesis protein CcmE
MSSQTVKIVASIVLIGGAATYLLADTLFADAEALTYFHPADAVMAQKAELTGKRIRMGGHVTKGTIFQKKGTLDYQFDVRPVPGMIKHPEFANSSVTVRYMGVVPDTFKDDAEVIVTGTLGSDGVFQANDLLAKCPSKYEAEAKSKGTY